MRLVSTKHETLGEDTTATSAVLGMTTRHSPLHLASTTGNVLDADPDDRAPRPMYDLEQVIKERRSTRMFLPHKPVPRELLDEALAAEQPAAARGGCPHAPRGGCPGLRVDGHRARGQRGQAGCCLTELGVLP